MGPGSDYAAAEEEEEDEEPAEEGQEQVPTSAPVSLRPLVLPVCGMLSSLGVGHFPPELWSFIHKPQPQNHTWKYRCVLMC